MRRSLVAVALLIVGACAGAPPPNRAAGVAKAPPTPPTPPTKPTATPTPPPPAPTGEPIAVAPSPTDTDGPRKRYPDAVVFMAPSALVDAVESDGLTQVPPTPFMPVVCSKHGAVGFGAACAPLVPAKAKARIVGGREVELVRGGGLPRDERPDLKPNEAPACCMYNGCQGVTVPFSIAGSARWLATKLAFAVWPADADVALEIPSGSKKDEVSVRGHAYRAAPGTFARRDGNEWKPLLQDIVQSARGTGIVAVTDVNHDGKNEVFVYAPYANDHGFAVIADDSDKPGWSYNCGNI